VRKTAKTRRRVAIDTVPLPEKTFGMKMKKAKVSKVRGKYFVAMGKRKLEIPVGTIVAAKDVNKLVGKDVYVALSNKRPAEIVGIGIWPIRIRCYWIVCYIPAPDIFRRVQDTIRQTLLKKMVSSKVISDKLGRQIKANFMR
jgi:hypothetical protein